jgi:DNA-binding XRE family transcriptional regulator
MAVSSIFPVAIVFLAPGTTILFPYGDFPRPRREDPMQTFGELLRLRRKSANLSQEALARATGLTVTSLYALERGACSPDFRSVQRLAAALGLALGDFEGLDLPNDGRKARREQGRTV